MKLCVCAECSVSITNGSHCSLCAKAMISNNNSMEAISMKTSSINAFAITVLSEVIADFQAIANNKKAYQKANKGVFMKNSLVINDLTFESMKLSYGDSIASSYGERNEEEEETVESIFADTDLEYSELEMLGKHTQSFLESIENYKMDLETAKAILTVNGFNFNGMSDELIIEVASQWKDRSEQGSSMTYRKDDRVKVTVQRKSTEGNWYTAKRTEADGSKTKISYFFEVEDLFDLDDNGNIINLKMCREQDQTVLNKIMFDMGYRELHLQYVGKGNYVPVEQRFLLACQALKNVEKLCGFELNQVVEPFNYVWDKESKKVVKQYTSFAYENLTDIGGNIVVLPCDNAESIEETLNRKYGEGILTGTCVADNFMAMADIEKSEVENNNKIEASLNKEAKKERVIAVKKNAAIDTRKESFMYQKAVELIKLSEVGELVVFEPETLDSDLGIQNLSNVEKLEAKLKYFQEMLNNARLYKSLSTKEARKNGIVPGFCAKDYKELCGIINKYMSYVKIEAVIESPAHILTNINALNNGSKKVTDFTVDQLIAIYKTAAKHRVKHPEFNLNANVAKTILSITKAA